MGKSARSKNAGHLGRAGLTASVNLEGREARYLPDRTRQVLRELTKLRRSIRPSETYARDLVVDTHICGICGSDLRRLREAQSGGPGDSGIGFVSRNRERDFSATRIDRP